MEMIDQPPTGSPVPFDPPNGTGPRRRTVVLVTLAAAGLVGGGVAVAGELVTADRSDTRSVAESESVSEPVMAASDVVPVGGVSDDGFATPDATVFGECVAAILGSPMIVDGVVPGDGAFPVVDGLVPMPAGPVMTPVGPDGLEIVEFGEGDATVTITRSDGDLAVQVDGDASVVDLPSLSDLDLDGLDLEALDLEALDLDGLDLDGLDLDSWLDGLDLDGLDLEGLDLESLDLEGLDLDAWLEGLDLDSWLEGLDLESLDLESLDLEGLDAEDMDVWAEGLPFGRGAMDSCVVE